MPQFEFEEWMMLDGDQQKEYLEEHIPYRLYLLDSLCAMTLLRHFDKQIVIDSHASSFAIMTNDGAVHAPLADLYNISLEAGLIQARLLIEFMGLRLDGRTGHLTSQTHQKDDVTISNFVVSGSQNLTCLSIKQIDNLGSITLQNDEVVSAHDLLAYLLLSANKSAAHITSREKPNPGFRWFVGALLVRVLIEQLVYLPLNSNVAHSNGWTTILLPDKLAQQHAVWHSQVMSWVASGLE